MFRQLFSSLFLLLRILSSPVLGENYNGQHSRGRPHSYKPFYSGIFGPTFLEAPTEIYRRPSIHLRSKHASWFPGHFSGNPKPPSPRYQPVPEGRLAWLEYLGNVYVQGDLFTLAQGTIWEMYRWLNRFPSLRCQITRAAKLLQRRIDERLWCRLRTCQDSSCRGRKRTWQGHGEITGAAQRYFPYMMRQFHNSSAKKLSMSERKFLDRIHRYLFFQNVGIAMKDFQRYVRHRPGSRRKCAIEQLEFVLKMVRFDLKNPDNCMPLWQSSCQLGWRAKGLIIEAYNMLRANRSSIRGRARMLMNKVNDLPMGREIKARLLVAAGRPEAARFLGLLRRWDQHLARACLVLQVVPRSHGMGRRQHFDKLNSRAKAKSIYIHCLHDRYALHTRRCSEALSQINRLEKTFPCSGFIRIGTFSQVFGEYLFAKCRAPNGL
jgi:hypothetical protein